MTNTQDRYALRSQLRATIDACAPKVLVDALDWLESTDPALDLDDARLAERNAAYVLGAIGEDMDAASREGALLNDMPGPEVDRWTWQDERDFQETIAMLRGDA